MNINLHIERLILDDIGVESYQGNEIKSAVESELKRQLVSQEIVSGLQTKNNQRAVRGGSILIDNTHKPVCLGQKIGNAIYNGIRK